jgi:hypothetical protein
VTASRRRALVAALFGAAAVAALFVVPGPFSMVLRVEALGLAVVLAACLQVRVDVVDGSPAAIGCAVVVALAVLLHEGGAFAVFGVGLALTSPAWAWRASTRHTLGMVAATGAAMAAAVGGQAGAARVADALSMHGEVALLVRVAGAGAAFVAVELAAAWLAGRPQRGTRAHMARARERRARTALLGLYLALLCAAALLVLASRELGPAAALVAAVPLLIIQFSFARYARARRTYDQAVLALSIVPEVAGHASLGHGERTAYYAGALTRSFHLEPKLADRVVTAAKIHHLGRVLEEQGSPGERSHRPQGEAAAELLAEIPFLQDVADLVAAVGATPGDGDDIGCAIVRVATTFDDLTGVPEPDVGSACAKLLDAHQGALESTVAERLVELCRKSPALVLEAHRQGSYLPSTVPSDLSEFQRL